MDRDTRGEVGGDDECGQEHLLGEVCIISDIGATAMRGGKNGFAQSETSELFLVELVKPGIAASAWRT